MNVFHGKFQELVKQPIEGQLEFFLKRYIFVLGENWKQVADLATKFTDYSDAKNSNDLNVTEAADFLQKNGKTRTATERKEELKDIDLDNNGRICFIEYLLLHYKVMIIKDFYETKGKSIPKEIDLSRDGVGVTGVGNTILEALFTFGNDIDPKVEAAIEEVMRERKAREDSISDLNKTIRDTSKTQVQRMKAQHELLRIEHEDTSGADVALITLMATRRKVKKNAVNSKEKNEKAFKEEQDAKAEAERQKLEQSKGKLSAMLNKFKENAKTDDAKFQNNAANRASIQAIRNGGLNLYSASARKDV